MAPATSIRAAHAKQVLHRDILSQFLLKHPDHHPSKGLPALPKVPSVNRDVLSDHICIVGAGTCGLYMAMALKYLGFTNVNIVEATGSVGGRCFTWQKTEPPPQNGQIDDHFYYDIGAMRIPPLPWMTGQAPLLMTAYISYWYKNDPISDQPFENLMSVLATDSRSYLPGPNNSTLDLQNNYSTRTWLMNKATPTVWSYSDTAMAELNDTSTGLFDQALTETVIDYADFKNASIKDKDWYRIEEGMQLVPETMAQMLASTSWPPTVSQPAAWNVTLNTPVTGYSFNPTSQTVSVASSASTATYDMVFNTTAMGPLQRMDISGLNLPNNVLDGIRSLSYDRATKVAIKFTEAWWTTKYNIIGGVSSSDLPISNVVYPSWNDGDGPAVLMVSYSWAQDATRMGSMVADYNVPGVTRTRDDPLVTLCLNDLVQLFKSSTPPLQFSDLYDLVVTDPNDHFDNSDPAGYHFALAGEALSAHHAWICGAFDSAYTTLCTWFQSMGRTDLIDKLQDSDFGDGTGQHVQEWDDKLFGWVVHFSGQREQARELKKLVVEASKPEE
ncbi:hypothetical protein B0H67DRAFT_687835 [Lasiosphaeris hirsuta]|uniref:Amine oxidase domain-containing protein n=1 Tax=Lasiosphaeris hirsuta TaxID=260670 RepID=A0AA39ZS66_9PEZI|nr:hypothetical protein B0H67DRAFT_687835 [Lasiosphaeris hirsuta]